MTELNPMNDSVFQFSLFSNAEQDESSAQLVLCGGGNALLVHLGALHRLYELGRLKGLYVRGASDFAFTPEEKEILLNWNMRSKHKIEKGESFLDVFGGPVRALREKRLTRWRPSGSRMGQVDDFWSMLSRPLEGVSWGAKHAPENHGASFVLSDGRHEEMKKLMISHEHLPELGMDYLIDWGYVLCDAALFSQKIGTSPEHRAFVSPNRLFYRPFEHESEASMLLETPTAQAAKSPTQDQTGVKAA
jgi:hypothetical protein